MLDLGSVHLRGAVNSFDGVMKAHSGTISDGGAVPPSSTRRQEKCTDTCCLLLGPRDQGVDRRVWVSWGSITYGHGTLSVAKGRPD